SRQPEPQWPQLLTPQRPEPQWPAVTKTPDQRCQVQVQDTVQCGTPDITPSQCQAIDCCFNGQQCFYGKAGLIFVPGMFICWGEMTAPAVLLASLQPLPYTSSLGYVVYENRMVSSYNVRMGPRGSITRDSHFESFLCKIEFTLLIPQRKIRTSHTCKDLLKRAEFPAPRFRSNLVLIVEHCWTTSAPSPVSMPQWDLFIEECPYQNYNYLTTMVPVLIYYLLFTNLFYAILSCQIFIHCSTSVCYPTPGVSCEPKCNRQRR
uniref:Zona pellucida sperm-binding protein 4 n=1 Tax=Hucho hucho TaxID=62062 RepID=A0A4W5RTW2_9TELE